LSKRDNSSLILQNLKKRELRVVADPIVAIEEAEKRMSQSDAGQAVAIADSQDSYRASYHSSSQAIAPDTASGTRLKPRERAARSALIVRLDPRLHRRLEQIARFNRLTMNDIVIEAIELHLGNFPQPPDLLTDDAERC
jgi:predicted HicB family RNase H-like nuclease